MVLQAMEPRNTAGIDTMLKIALQILRPPAERKRRGATVAPGKTKWKVSKSPDLRQAHVFTLWTGASTNASDIDSRN